MNQFFIVIGNLSARTFTTFDKAAAYVKSLPFSQRGLYEIVRA